MIAHGLLDKLQALNCRYNYKIGKGCKCYSKECSMNVFPELREKIQQEGCKVFLRPEVQELIKKEEVNDT